MAEEKYLHPEQHYIDRYDLWTIEKCVEVIKTFQEVYQRSLTEEKLKNLPKEEKVRSVNLMLGQHLFVVKAKEYQRKKETVQKWMDEDRLKQDKYDNTPPPSGIRCVECGAVMHSTFKTLHYGLNEPSRMLFFFDCPSCKKRRALWDNSEEWEHKAELCEKCNKEVETTHKKEGDVMTWITKCAACGHTETRVDDFEKRQTEREKREQAEKLLLEKYRAEFCLSEEEGPKEVATLESMEVAAEVYEEEVAKYDGPAYQTTAQLKRLNIVELENLLRELLEKQHYIKLALEKPEEGRFFAVPFSVQDGDSSRTENESVYTLEKLLKKSLEGTNWRLMTGGVHYRLGYISGRLRGYEKEEDLMELYEKKNEKKSSKVSDEMRQKYAYSSWVRLAKISGEYKGIENVRKRRLEKEPDGFFLEESEGPLPCGICGQRVPGNKSWWTLKGITCADCHRNIQEGVIPDLTKRKDDTWFSGYDLKSKYSVWPSTRGRLEREGLLHGRALKESDGKTYYTVYLVEDNAEFFKQYPYKPEMDIRLEWSPKDEKFLLYAKKIEYPEDAAKKQAKARKRGKQ